MTNHAQSSWTERERYANEIWRRHQREERLRRAKVLVVAGLLAMATVAGLVAFLAREASR